MPKAMRTASLYSPRKDSTASRPDTVAGSAATLRPSLAETTGGEKRKRTCDEDDDEEGEATSSHARKPSSGFVKTALRSKANRVLPNPAIHRSSTDPSDYYIRSKDITNEHTISLKFWDEQIKGDANLNLKTPDPVWSHRFYADLNTPDSRKTRCELVNLITVVTGIEGRDYFLCIPCERRPAYLPAHPHDASSHLLKTVRICLFRKITDPALLSKYEKDAKAKASLDVARFAAVSGSTQKSSSSGATRDRLSSTTTLLHSTVPSPAGERDKDAVYKKQKTSQTPPCALKDTETGKPLDLSPSAPCSSKSMKHTPTLPLSPGKSSGSSSILPPSSSSMVVSPDEHPPSPPFPTEGNTKTASFTRKPFATRQQELELEILDAEMAQQQAEGQKSKLLVEKKRLELKIYLDKEAQDGE